MKMKTIITQEMTLEFKWYRKDKVYGLFCSNHHALQYVWGSKISSSDLVNWKGVERIEGGYFIPQKVLNKRLEFIRAKHKQYGNSIKIIEKVREKVKKKDKNDTT